MNFYLLPSIETGPAIVQKLASLISKGELDIAAEMGRFSPREVYAHLADWEPIMRSRILAAINSPGEAIEAFDEVQMGIDHDYVNSDTAVQLQIYASERKVTADLLRSLIGDVWNQSVVHPERGEQTVSDIANLLLGHDLYHILQLTASIL